MSDNLAWASLDRRSIVLQLRDELRDVIATEGLKPGDQLPPEAEIAARFGVARGTVREAFKLLEQGGLIDVRHGSGRFVSAIGGLKVERPVTDFESVTEMLTALGYRPWNKILSVDVVPATPDEADALGLAAASDVVRLRRLRMHGQKTLIYEIDTFSAGLLEERSLAAEDFSGSLNKWLEAKGHPPVSSVAQIRAVELPVDLTREPGVDAAKPWLLITERCVDPRGVPVLYSQDYHRGDVFSFHVLRQRAT